MRCNAFCLGHDINLDRLKNSLSRRAESNVSTFHLENCIYQVVQDNSQSKTIFYFDQGTMITWNMDKAESIDLAKKCLKFADEKAPEIELDDFSYQYGKETTVKPQGHFNVEVITLASEDPLLKLAISYALSQSVKLHFFNDLTQKIFDEHSHIINKMRKNGRVKLSARRLRKIVAQIFTLKNRLHVDSEFLTVPHYFWKQSSTESEYILTHDFLDIENRVAALNQKVDVLGDMFDMFNSQIEHSHTFRLEVIITILIAVEILESLPRFF